VDGISRTPEKTSGSKSAQAKSASAPNSSGKKERQYESKNFRKFGRSKISPKENGGFADGRKSSGKLDKRRINQERSAF
jgi:hypothetical protein